jgi:hypothetical protein
MGRKGLKGGGRSLVFFLRSHDLATVSRLTLLDIISAIDTDQHSDTYLIDTVASIDTVSIILTVILLKGYR